MALPSQKTNEPTKKKKGEALKQEDCTRPPNIKKQIKPKELELFCLSLAPYLKANTNHAEALEILASRWGNPVMAHGLYYIALCVKKGISEDMAYHQSGLFDENFCQIIKAGRTSSRLPECLATIADRAKTISKLQGSLKKVLFTPIIVIVLLTGVFTASNIFLIPKIKAILTSVDVAPDMLSAIVFKVNDIYLACYWYLIPIVFGTIGYIFKNPKTRFWTLEMMSNKWRKLQRLLKSYRQMTFLSILALLVKSGTKLTDSIPIAAGTVKNTNYEKELLECNEYVKRGMSFADTLDKFSAVDKDVVSFVQTGEKTAQLGEKLQDIAVIYKEECTATLEDLTTVISSFATILCVIVIAIVFVMNYMPLLMLGPRLMSQT